MLAGFARIFKPPTELLPGGVDNENHPVDVAIARLRSGIGVPAMIETVVRRGYRLAIQLN